MPYVMMDPYSDYDKQNSAFDHDIEEIPAKDNSHLADEISSFLEPVLQGVDSNENDKKDSSSPQTAADPETNLKEITTSEVVPIEVQDASIKESIDTSAIPINNQIEEQANEKSEKLNETLPNGQVEDEEHCKVADTTEAKTDLNEKKDETKTSDLNPEQIDTADEERIEEKALEDLDQLSEKFSDAVDFVASINGVDEDIQETGFATPNINKIELGDEEKIYDSERGDEEYIVENIIDKKVDENGMAHYLVKWEGYPHSANTWEPIDNLADCDKAMRVYEIRRAEKLALRQKRRKYNPGVMENGNGKAGPRGRPTYEVDDILGVTKISEEKYFLVSLKGLNKPTFVRTSLANKMFPNLVIDFYIKHLKWKPKA